MSEQEQYSKNEVCMSSFAPILLKLYGYDYLRSAVWKAVLRLEKGAFYSATARDILKKYHGVSVGAYIYGTCMSPGALPAGVKVGRYVSTASDIKVFLRNHPIDWLSTHPFFFDANLGYLHEDAVQFGELTIESDSWIAERVIITQKCSRIGFGAIVGSGSVVTKDVPDFAVVAGVPARILRFRFPESIQQLILDSRWWEKSLDQLLPSLEHLSQPLTQYCNVESLLSRFINKQSEKSLTH